MTNVDIPIGGYFELEVGVDRFNLSPFLLYQSARAAFLALLRTRLPKRVWLPTHICNSMVAPVEKSTASLNWYDLNEDLSIKSYPELGSDDLILYVNYFGVCEKNVDELLRLYPSDQVIVDNSQAFFARPKSALATLYSPRKFFGVPDGGMLVSAVEINLPTEIDVESVSRCNHLVMRLGLEAEDGYQQYQLAEKSLLDFEPKQMSRFTRRILKSIDMETVLKRRAENFDYLLENLGNLNDFEVDENSPSPMFFPFKGDARLRQKLLEARIFVPRYWEDAKARSTNRWSDQIIEGLLPLPIDQRYTASDLSRLVKIVRGKSVGSPKS